MQQVGQIGFCLSQIFKDLTYSIQSGFFQHFLESESLPVYLRVYQSCLPVVNVISFSFNLLLKYYFFCSQSLLMEVNVYDRATKFELRVFPLASIFFSKLIKFRQISTWLFLVFVSLQ